MKNNKAKFQSFLSRIKNDVLFKVCGEICSSKEYVNFFEWPGSIGKHHSYEGGLYAHTVEVTEYAYNTSKMFHDKIDTDVLLAACLWHDVAKIWDYELVHKTDAIVHGKELVIKDVYTGWIKGDYHGKIHHISGGCAEFTAMALKHHLNRETIQRIQHCIVSHHGFNKNFGSPRMPESLEAIILHQSDMLSATYGESK